MIPQEVLDKAHMVAQLANAVDMQTVTDVLTPWIRDDPQSAARVMYAMSDLDRVLKDGHAAYTRGERSVLVVDLERQYQRQKRASYRKKRYDLNKYREAADE